MQKGFSVEPGVKQHGLFSRRSLECFVALMRAKIALRYYTSLLGSLWGIIGPLAMLAVLFAVFSSSYGEKLGKYPLYLLLGISCVNYFNGATIRCMHALKADRALVLNTPVRRELSVLSEVVLPTRLYIVELLLCAFISWCYGSLSFKILLLPLIIVIQAAFAAGAGLIAALAYCYLRDFENVWYLVTRLMLFATPVFYSLDMVDAVVGAFVYWLNPLTPLLLSLRQAVIAGSQFEPSVFAHALLVGAVGLTAGLLLFSRFQLRAVEEI